MSPATIDHLRAARVPWEPGMLGVCGTDGLRVLVVRDEVPAEWTCVPEGRELHAVVTGYGTPGWCDRLWADIVPDLRDRLTFLACCDMLAWRDGGDRLGPEFGPHPLNALRTWGWWDYPPHREHAIAALARALAESAPVSETERTGGPRG